MKYKEAKKYNLLITDPYTPQSYDVLLGLYNSCKKVVVSIPDLGRFSGLFNYTANSRLILKRYRLKSGCNIKAEDIVFSCSSEQKEKEGRYISEISALCDREQIDLIFPTSDDEVLLLAKHIELFRKKNIIIPVNTYEVLKKMMDKLSLVKLAQEAGIPCPKTEVVKEDDLLGDNRNIFDAIQIIKPRFGSASRGVEIIRGKEDFLRWIKAHRKKQACFIIQEFIPGDTVLYYRVYMQSDGSSFYTSCAKCKRPEMMLHQGRAIMLETSEAPWFADKVISLLRIQNYIGYGHVQLKVDKRDKVAKVMEFNARLSRGTWTEMRTGVDATRVLIALFQNNPLEAVPINNKKIFFFWPIQDFFVFLIYTFFLLLEKIKAIFSGKTLKLERKLPKWKSMRRHYWQCYFGKNKQRIYDNYFSNVFKDPKVSGSYWIVFCFYIVKEFKRSLIQRED